MNELNPTQIFVLSDKAYELKNGFTQVVKRDLANALPFVDVETLKPITATSGLITPVASGFGFMAQLNGGRSREIVIATRGTTNSFADYGTDINAIPTPGPTGHAIHKGFNTTFKSYVQQLNEFIKQQNLGFKPTAVHCMGHSLGGALANLNAAACAELGLNSYLYTVAAPRVGMVPYAEHLSKKMNAEHVYRVANEADAVTMLSRLGAQSLLSVGHYGTGAFTVLDQMSEILARYAQASHKQAKEVAGMLNAIMAYLGRSTHAVANASVATIRWVFNLLHQSVNTMAKQAIQLVGR